MNYYLTALKKYAVFSGRARRKEYWIFIGINTVLIFGLFVLATMMSTDQEPNPIIFSLALIILLLTLLPTLAVTARRLHDTDKSAWWMLLLALPLLGLIVTLFTLLKGTAGDNKYGPDPIKS